MASKPLTFTLHVGDQEIERLSDEQLEAMETRLGETMSTYYTAHPEEYKKIKTKGGTKNANSNARGTGHSR